MWHAEHVLWRIGMRTGADRTAYKFQLPAKASLDSPAPAADDKEEEGSRKDQSVAWRIRIAMIVLYDPTHPKGSNNHYVQYIPGPQSHDIVANAQEYAPYTHMDPLLFGSAMFLAANP